MLAFPEAFDYVGVPGTSESFEKASLLTDHLMQEYRAVAKANNVWLSLGKHKTTFGLNRIGECCIMRFQAAFTSDWKERLGRRRSQIRTASSTMEVIYEELEQRSW